MVAAGAARTLSLVPQLQKRALRKALGSFDDADLATPAGQQRIVESVSRAYAENERRMLPPAARRIDPHRIEAIVRVALRDIVAACA